MTVIRNNTRVGSSPRVRGTFSLYRVLSVFLGLIPAGAGNMRMKIITNGGSRAHPRGCGEHQFWEIRQILRQGSSPRVRGTSRWLPLPTSIRGLIPAGAGNMRRACRVCACRGAHPRGCGEHSDARTVACASKGSSPRVRGTYFLTWGFTPIPQVLVLV